MYIPDRCAESCQPLDVGILGPVKMQCNAGFKNHAGDVVESHRKLSIKYEAFVKAWRHLSKQTVVGASEGENQVYCKHNINVIHRCCITQIAQLLIDLCTFKSVHLLPNQ